VCRPVIILLTQQFPPEAPQLPLVARRIAALSPHLHYHAHLHHLHHHHHHHHLVALVVLVLVVVVVVVVLA
jgi:hypothetical protein